MSGRSRLSLYSKYALAVLLHPRGIFWLTVIGAITAGLITSCSVPEQSDSEQSQSKIKVTNDEAASGLDARVEKSAEVRFNLNRLKDFQNLVFSGLDDLGKTFATSSGMPIERFKEPFGKVQEYFRETAQTLIQEEADGSWNLSRIIPGERFEYSCTSTRARVHGIPAGESGEERQRYWLQDCDTGKEVDFAQGKSDRSGEMEISFALKPFQTKLQPLLDESECSISVVSKSTTMRCDPIEIGIEGRRYTLHIKKIGKERDGQVGLIRLTVKNFESLPEGEVIWDKQLQVDPNWPTYTFDCTVEECIDGTSPTFKLQVDIDELKKKLNSKLPDWMTGKPQPTPTPIEPEPTPIPEGEEI